MDILVIIPTLNEEKNILKIVTQILKLYPYKILVIDDNSKDKTIEILEKIKKSYKKFNFVVRKNTKGIGSAHLFGINYAYKNKFDYCITLDADGTHDPRHIREMISIINKKSLNIVATSRFLKKNSLSDWPIHRVIITKIRYYLVKYILNSSVDSSGGYRCYDLKKINKKIFNRVNNKNYFFLIESMYLLEKEGYKVFEIPIKLKYRSADQSKMRIFHIFESLFALLILRFR